MRSRDARKQPLNPETSTLQPLLPTLSIALSARFPEMDTPKPKTLKPCTRNSKPQTSKGIHCLPTSARRSSTGVRLQQERGCVQVLITIRVGP